MVYMTRAYAVNSMVTMKTKVPMHSSTCNTQPAPRKAAYELRPERLSAVHSAAMKERWAATETTAQPADLMNSHAKSFCNGTCYEQSNLMHILTKHVTVWTSQDMKPTTVHNVNCCSLYTVWADLVLHDGVTPRLGKNNL